MKQPLQAHEVPQLLEVVRNEYIEVQNELKETGERIKAYVDETNARLQEIEQRAVRRTGQGGGIGMADTAGNEVIHQLADSPVLAQLAKSGRGAPAAAHVNQPLQAILGNGGKTTGSSDGNIASNPERSGIYIGPTRPLTLLDVLPSRPTERDSVEHVRLTSTLPAGVQAYEGDEKAEIDADGELVKSEIVTIAGHTTASRQVLSDHAGLRATIDGLLSNKVRSELELRVVLGDSVNAGEFEGLVKLSTAFISSGSPTFVDGIGQIIADMQAEGFVPSAILVNSDDWHAGVATSKDQEGRYLFGNPATPLQPALWNVPVVLTASVAAGSVIVLDASYVTLLDRQALQVLVSEHHKDNFTKNLVTVLAELRAGLEVRHARAVRRWEFEGTWNPSPSSSSGA